MTASASDGAAEHAQSTSDEALVALLPGGFRNEYVTANGIRLHAVVGGRGRPLVLLHGWPQTWWEYHKVMPALAADHLVVAVDLRGGGSSDKPAGGYDKRTMAADIAALVAELGLGPVDVAGHDIGSMVAYSMAVNHPDSVHRLVMLDVVHPNESFYETRILPRPGQPFFPWWFAFNNVQGLPEKLVAGRSRVLIDWMFDTLLRNRDAVDDFDRRVYARSYGSEDGVRGGNGWYQGFSQDIIDQGGYGKLSLPVLGVAHDMFLPQMQATLPQQGTDVRIERIENTGHYFLDEQPDDVVRLLNGFLT